MPDEAEDGSAPVEVTTAATSFLFSNASTRTRSSFGRSASASQMVGRLFSAALHRGSAQRSSDGAVTTATGDEGVAAKSCEDAVVVVPETFAQAEGWHELRPGQAPQLLRRRR